MSEIKRVKIGSILESQIPEFLTVESPLLVEFLEQYYTSLESQGGSVDIISNINQYKNSKKFNRVDLISETTLTSDILTFDTTISVTSTKGWPDSYGLLKIDDEIITYTSKTETSFENCIRGFSGIENLSSLSNPEFAVFSSTQSAEHDSSTLVENLSNLFLLEFFENFKYEFLPGFEARDFYKDIKIENVAYKIKDLYSSKGTDQSYKLLFKILYGSDIEIIKPQDYTLTPSSNSYFLTKNILVEKISGGDPIDTKGNFLFQNITGIGTVSASIFNVEYRPISNKNFYEISLDSTSFSGNFEVSGKTRILESVPANSDSILVDSTVGFANSGSILVKPQNSDYITINYSGKNINQFTGITNLTQPLDFGLDLTEEKFAFSYIGVGNTSKVEFRVVNVIDNIDFSKTSNLRVGDTIALSGFGRDLFDEYQFNSWIYNIPTNHNIRVISQVDTTKYRVKLFDKVYFYAGERVNLKNSLGEFTEATVINVEYSSSDVVKKYTDTILVQTVNSGSYNVSESTRVTKKIYKANHYNNYFGDLSDISTGVQNTYIDSNNDYFYVTSSGLPNYPIFSTDNKKFASTNVGTALTDIINITSHNYESGELINYRPISVSISGISTGLYYVTKIDQNHIKLSYSKADVFSKKYILVNPGISSDIVYKSGYENKTLKHQKLLKKFPFGSTRSLFDDLNKRTTSNRELGMLSNGVEVLSPTLFDENIYYGALSSIEVTNSGEDYDVIDVPPIDILDETGGLSKAHVNITGSVREIKILNAGYGYQEKPKITIEGGNGVGCALESNLVTTKVSAGFKADVNVSTSTNEITFLTTIPFEDGEEIVYDSNKNTDLPGIVNSSTYFVGRISDTKIKLYNTKSDSLQKTNELDIVGVSSGFHFITTLKNKNTFTKIYVKDPGTGYSNRKIKVPSVLSANNSVSGINTFDSYIYAKNHGFSNGEYVVYSSSDTNISGLTTSSYYQVRVIDNNKFRLYDAGFSTSLSDENYTKNKFVKLDSLGVGTHTIGYPPIVVKVEAKSAVGSTTDIKTELKPIVLGSISDVYLEDGGAGYGCTNIINYHRRPFVGISSITSQAILKPIIIEGSIVDVQIIARGKGFRKNSEILVEGQGNYAQLEPIVEDGELSSVNIVFGGVGYGSSDTKLTLSNRGRNAKFLANVDEWKINQVVKSENIINKDDDGILHVNKNPELELQFISFYVPKKLRYQLSDNFTEDNKETTGTLQHSPILGYAYDGNPIYGPYAYDTTTGGFIRRMNPGYVLNVDTTSGKRPPSFPGGYFINDYTFDGSGDLDVHNGRFAITPEYPNGVYAYFSTIEITAGNESVPRYPYIVGPYFYNKPVEENFLPLYNQDFNVFDTSLSRNIGPYYLNRASSSYDLIDTVLEEYKQEFSVTEINDGKIESVQIFSSGDNYRIDDSVDIDVTGTEGIQSNIVVSELEGREVESFVVTEDLIGDLEFFIRYPNTVVKSTFPHKIEDQQPIVIGGISTITASEFEGIRLVNVANKESELVEDLGDTGVTGLSTFIKVKDVSGFSANDFIGIGTEVLLITKVDRTRSGFEVNRLENTGIHTVSGDNVKLLPREFTIETGSVKDYTFENYTTFFNPQNSVGVGTTGSYFNVVGFGSTSSKTRFVPTRSIYLPGHKFFTGQPLIYSSGFAGTSLYVNNPGIGVSIRLNDQQLVYAVNLGQDYIGLSTLGFTSTSGIGTNNNSLEFWDQEDFSGVIGAAHSLTTVYPRTTGTLQKTLGIVTTTSNHNLKVGDNIKLNISTDYNEVVKIIFDSVNRKVLAREISFTDTDVSLSTNSIDISSYEGNIETGDKVVYIAEYPINGLENYGIYYISKTGFNDIRLCKYRSDIQDSNFINLSSIGGVEQKFYYINPQISCIRTTKIEFDLSDSSLSNLDLQFYYDVNFVEKINEREGFFVTREGIPGQADAKVILDLSAQFFPIYYNLFPRGTSIQAKEQISTDSDVISNNKISIINHRLNRSFVVNSVPNETTFTFFNKTKLSLVEKQILINPLTTVSYKTNSRTALGPISDLRINFPGRGYKKLPIVKEVKSELGKNAVIKIISPNIGKVENFTRVKDGFDYPTDPTLSPSLSVPTVVGVKDIRTIDYIGITTGGRRYNSAPKLVIKDDYLGIEAVAVVNGGSVTDVIVTKNSTSIAKPFEIVPTFNSNGYEIDTIQVIGDQITLELSNLPGISPFLPVGFGQTEYVYPFSIGDKIFIENCRLTDLTSHRANFNSASYNYAFFEVTGVSTANNTVTYDMSGISTGTFGTYTDEFNLGVVINKKDMPVFEMVLKDDVNYASNEKVSSSRFSGAIMEGGWDGNLNQMRLKDVSGDITIGDAIFGETSKITGTVQYFDKFNLFATLGVSRDKRSSVDLSSGILNDFSQRISDNFYYQKFSYSIKGNIPYSTWRESVRSILHPSGFKEFSDLEVFTSPSENEVNIGIAKSVNMKPRLNATDSFTFLNIDNTTSFGVKKNFARAYEEELLPNGSTQNIYFDEGIDLTSYILNKTNKVLTIDDISNEFDGTSEQYLRGRFADAADLMKLNRSFIQEEVVAFVEFNYPNIGLSTTYSREKCLRDTGFIVDAVAHDIKYNSNNKSVEAGVYYWNAGSSYVSNETEETLFAYNYVKFISQYVINNQTPPTLYQTAVTQQFNFALIPDPLNPDFNRYKDSRNLILANRREILDRSLASVGIGFPDFYFPGDDQTNERSRYYDGYRLIQQNRTEIINTAWSNTLSVYPGITTTENKCKRDIGYFVDAVSIDIFTGGNNYSREFTLQYFNNGIPITNGLVGEEAESIYAFVQARDLMRTAVRNGLTITDVGITSGPPTYGVGTTVSNTDSSACTDVQTNIITLVGIVTAVVASGSTSILPVVNFGTYTTGGNKCFRDLGYIIDGVAQDLSYGTNQHTIYNTKKYFDGVGAALTNGLLGEESESVYAFESAKGYMKQAITNQLYSKDLTITADPLTGFNTDTSSCADVQSNIDTLVGILTVAIGNSSLAGIPTENYGTADCADVRSAIGNYVGIITTIIGFGTDFAPEVTYPSLTRGGAVVGLTTFKLKNKGTPLFKHSFTQSSIDPITDTFTIQNHNYQSGQELLYTYDGGTPIGIGTTSYLTGPQTTLLNVHEFDGTALYEEGYNVAISTTVSGTVALGTPFEITQWLDVIGVSTNTLSGVGTHAVFNVLISHDAGGAGLDTSIVLKYGGSGFNVGDTVSIAGTNFNGGSSPANDLSFVVSKTGPTVLQLEANQAYLSVPSIGSTETTFDVSRNNNGEISYVKVLNGGSGYDPNSVVSIAGTYLGGQTPLDNISVSPLELGSKVLPPTVFVFKLNDNQFKLSGLSTSVFLNITEGGTGTHSLEYKDPNASVIVTIDGIIQKGLARKSLEVSLGSSVSTASTTILDISSGISSLNVRDTINLDNEIVSIKTIGVSSSTQIEVERGYFGSVASAHTVGTSATVLNGDFNIIGDVIYFDTAPYGKIGPVGLETGSIFGGRVFSRQFDPSTPKDRNLLFDDISLSFTGIAATEFSIKVDGQTTDTIFNDVNSSTEINNNPILLINNVFQDPTSDYTVDGSGSNTIRFLSGTPKAGRISKVGVTSSYGYIPRLGAAAYPVVSAAGTISDVIVSGGGSGYRGVPVVSIAATIGYGASIVATVSAAGTVSGFTIVNPGTGYTTTSIPEVVIGIPTGYSNLVLGYTGGTSGVGQGAKLTVDVGFGSSITSYKFDSPGVGYKVGDRLTPLGLGTDSSLRDDTLNISNVQYDNTTGVTTITTVEVHNIGENEKVILTGIAFTCGYDEVGISTFSYDEASGICTVVTYSPHGLLRTDVDANKTSDEVFLFNLPFSCAAEHAGVTTTIFPDGTSSYGRVFPVLTSISSTSFTMNAGISTIPHVFEGWPEIGISTFAYYEVTGLSTVTTSSNHEFAVGDKVTLSGLAFTCNSAYAGLTTTIFPDGTSEYGYTFTVTSVNSSTEFEFLAGISTIVHYYNGGGYTKKVPTAQRVLRYVDDSTDGAYDFRVTSVGSTNEFTIQAGSISTIPHYYTQSGIVTFKQYEPFVLTVEEVETDSFSGFYPGQFIQFDDVSQFFNGFRKKFTLSTTLNGVRSVIGLRVPDGTDLDITNNIFIYLNDVLQVPGISYTFSGSRVVFKEAPISGSKCVILYYRGSSVDVELVDPPKTIKPGDEVVIQENPLDPFDISQFERVVKNIVTSDQLETFNYFSVGIITDPTRIRPLTWKKQEQDTVINGTLYSKARPSIQSGIKPQATVIKTIGIDDTVIYVDNAYPLFTDVDNLSEDIRDCLILEQRDIEPCIVQSVVSTSSSISSINIIDGGVGYANTQSPKVVISESAILQKDPIFSWSSTVGLSTSYNLRSVKYNDKLVAVGDSSVYAESIDGINWQIGTLGFGQTSNFNSIQSVGIGTSNILVSVGSAGKIIQATDYGTSVTNWEQILLQEENSIPGLGAVSRVSSGYTGTFNEIVYSSTVNSWVAVGAGGSIFVANGITTDAFVSRFSETLSDLNSVAFGSNYYVAVGNDGVIRTSNNGTIWEFATSPVVTNLNKVIHAGDNFVIVGDSGIVLRSTSRTNYEVITTNLSGQNIVNLYYNYGFYVALMSNGDLYYSFDLSEWIYRSTSQVNSINDVVFVNTLGPDGRYIAVGSGATAIYAEPVYNRATATSTTNNGVVTSIEIDNPGFGYQTDNVPAAIVELDTYSTELIRSFKVVGDHGIIIGIQTYISGTPGIGTTSPKVSFALKSEQYDNSTLGIGYSSLNTFGITNSQLSKGDYFVITDSNVETGGNLIGISTLLGGMASYPNSIVGVATNFIDGIYIVEDVTTPSLGIVTVTCNFAPMIDDYVQLWPRGENDTGINTSGYYGKYSWAKIYDYQNRVLGGPKTFEVFKDNGITGLSTSPKVMRSRNVVSR